MPLVDYWGHLGGMFSGFLLGWAVFDYIDPPTAADKFWKLLIGGVFALYTVCGTALFYTSVDT